MEKSLNGNLKGAIDDMLEGSVAGFVNFQSGSGTSNYNDLENKPSINEVELIGNKTSSQLGINELPDSSDASIGDVLTHTVSGDHWFPPKEYIAGDNITIENYVISASTSGGSINYSTSEEEIGTWINGDKIYRRTWVFDSPVEIQATSWGDTAILVSNTDINLIIDVKSMSSNGFNQCVGATTDGGTLTNVRLLNYRNSVIQVKYLTLDYTKSN